MIFPKAFESIIRSLYDLLGPNGFLNQPVSAETVERHTNAIFEQLDSKRIGSIDLDDFERYCLHVSMSNSTKKKLSRQLYLERTIGASN